MELIWEVADLRAFSVMIGLGGGLSLIWLDGFCTVVAVLLFVTTLGAVVMTSFSANSSRTESPIMVPQLGQTDKVIRCSFLQPGQHIVFLGWFLLNDLIWKRIWETR
ncbi:MAG: hypothetical protein OEM82_12395 [Acidobacteriota bacterium]|nr:hypothetical protein [Acidobacteriota bacterium]MDH3530635.1 hypothetical protein [Acidobacteriota bacterium]